MDSCVVPAYSAHPFPGSQFFFSRPIKLNILKRSLVYRQIVKTCHISTHYNKINLSWYELPPTKVLNFIGKRSCFVKDNRNIDVLTHMGLNLENSNGPRERAGFGYARLASVKYYRKNAKRFSHKYRKLRKNARMLPLSYNRIRYGQ